MGFYITSEIFGEILEGVKYLHNKNIIHRDLNLENILLKNGKTKTFVKIADLGLSKVHDINKLHSRDRGHIGYSAPEVQNGEEYDTKADVYSLGVIMQKMFNISVNR